MAAEDLTPEALCAPSNWPQLVIFMQAAGHKFISYKKGVELCRQAIKNCPNSKMPKLPDLLRESVPADRHEYGLTNEGTGNLMYIREERDEASSNAGHVPVITVAADCLPELEKGGAGRLGPKLAIQTQYDRPVIRPAKTRRL